MTVVNIARLMRSVGLNRKVPFTIVLLVIVMCTAGASADPNLPDTLYLDSVVTEIPMTTRMPLSAAV